ncbi:MAG: hypothetical protein V9G20_04780 [Candidatus Promineifilaceae bacterium]
MRVNRYTLRKVIWPDNPCPIPIRVSLIHGFLLSQTHCVIGLFAFVKPGQTGMIQ